MSETWYKVTYDDQVKPVKVLRETAAYVTVLEEGLFGAEPYERRMSKTATSEPLRVFKTYAEARRCIVSKAEARVRSCQSAYDRAVNELREANAIPEHEPGTARVLNESEVEGVSEPTFRTAYPPAEAEPRDDREPVAQVEGALSRLIEKCNTEYRDLMAQVQANRRTHSKLATARAALGVTEE